LTDLQEHLTVKYDVTPLYLFFFLKQVVNFTPRCYERRNIPI